MKDLKLPLVLLLLALASVAQAQFTFTTNADNTLTLASYTGSDVEVAIPGVTNNMLVAEIGDSAFANDTTLASVIIPDSVISIGDYAFENCTSLTNATIGNGVVAIGISAFDTCSSLVGIAIPDRVTSIGNYAFEHCTSLTNVAFGVSVLDIGDWAFYAGTGLTSITIPDNTTNIGVAAFNGCGGLVSITLGSGVVTIGSSAFGSCPNVSGITIPDSVADIGDNAFEYCRSLVNAGIGAGVTNIGDYAFDGCDGLTGVALGRRVSSIGVSAFESCSSLAHVVVPDSVTSIGEYAFAVCTSMTNITFGSGVASLGDGVLEGCTNLSAITVAASNVVYSSVGGVLSDQSQSSLLLCPEGLTGSFTIPDGVSSIGGLAFNGCVGLTNIIIADSITNIGASAFGGTSVVGMMIPASVIGLGNNVFGNCPSLVAITADPANPVFSSVGGVLFDQAQTTLIQYPGGRAGSYAIPDGVSNVGNDAFYHCAGLTSLVISDSVTNIGSDACYDCVNLAGIWIGNGVLSIGNDAFYNCGRLASVNFGGSVASLGNYVFYNCRQLTNVIIPNSVTNIGSYAFGFCSRLTSATLGNGVNSIAGYAFYECTSLTNVCFEGNAPSANSTVFKYDARAIVYYYPGTTGWGSTFAGLRAVLLNPFPFTANLTNGVAPLTVSFVAPDNDGAGHAIVSWSWDFGDGGASTLQNPTYTYDSVGVYIPTLIATNDLGNMVLGGGAQITAYTDPSEFTWTTSNGRISITGYGGADSAVVVPGTINGLRVTSIGSAAFYNCSTLITVVLPSSVTSIGGSAFAACGSLTNVTIGSSVTSLGSYAFYHCASLIAINVDASNRYYSSLAGVLFNKSQNTLLQYPDGNGGNYFIPDSVTSIASYAFDSCSLTGITISNRLHQIGYGAFNNCTSLTSITVSSNNPYYSSINGVLFDKSQATILLYPEGMAGSYVLPGSVFSIGDYAFNDCWNLTGITIAGSVADIGDYAFSGCWNLPTVIIPDGVASVGVGAFENCVSLTNVMLGNNVTGIGDNAFLGCNLTSLTIPNSVLSIGAGSFADCVGLTNVMLGNSVTSIGDNAFGSCNLASVTIPGKVVSIGSYAFGSCSNLATAYFQGNAPAGDCTIFYGESPTIYYVPGMAGWSNAFACQLTAQWTLPYPVILNPSANWGTISNQFSLVISWATNAMVVVDACSDLANPVWIALATNVPSAGMIYFSDPQWTNYPSRYYRLRSP